MAVQKKREDRRIQRTRQVLQQAFMDIIKDRGLSIITIQDVEKSILATSIQDITERANVNRGTFYLHFTDKYMLTDAIIRDQFQQILANCLPPNARLNRTNLHRLIQTVLDSFESKYHHQRHQPHVLAPMLERGMQEELTEFILTWLKQERRGKPRGPVPLPTMARIVSWAICGTAIEWSQEETTISSQQMAHNILLVTLDGITHLIPDMSTESYQ